MNTNQNESPFGEIIYAYTRKQAIADGVQVDVTRTAQEAGIRFPVFLTRSVFDAYVAVPEDVTGQDEAGRLWDIIWMTRFAIQRSRPGSDRIPVALHDHHRLEGSTPQVPSPRAAAAPQGGTRGVALNRRGENRMMETWPAATHATTPGEGQKRAIPLILLRAREKGARDFFGSTTRRKAVMTNPARVRWMIRYPASLILTPTIP
jgi:hypothetical protein